MRTPQYDKLVETMPAGLGRAIMQVLKSHVGKAFAIKKDRILPQLLKLGYKVDERQFRDSVADLRMDGWLIGSGSSIGYYLCADLVEYDEFKEGELRSRLISLSNTINAMDNAALQRFGDGVQVGLL